ncbi:MAG: type II secretion system protein [candidate division WOR-3 bacterium]
MKRGFTLIELIVSILIFTIVMVGVVMFNAQNSRSITKSERDARKALLRERAIEEFKGWLKASPVAGERFDFIWNNLAIGDSIGGAIDSGTGIRVRLEVGSFYPEKEVNLGRPGVYLGVRTITSDPRSKVDTQLVFISRHN